MTSEKQNAGSKMPTNKGLTISHKIFITTALVLGMAGIIAARGTATAWEASIFHAINSWPDGWQRTMEVVTFFGSTTWAPLAVLIILLLRLYRLAWRLSFSIVAAYCLVGVLKFIVDRERPIGLFQDAQVRIAETGMGFPSGHATLSTIIALTLGAYLPHRWRWTLVLPIILVGISRLYLGVHIPLDIIGGMALGMLVVVGLRILPAALQRKLHID